MILLGIVLLVLYYALPHIIPDVPPGVEWGLHFFGWLFVIVGLVLFAFGHFSGRSIGNRRYWW
jgi:hypothetical protein